MRPAYPPPRFRGHPTFVLAWLLLAAAALAVAVLVGRAGGAAGANGHLRVGTQLAVGASSIVAALTALGLFRRSRWALPLAVLEFALGAGVCFVVMVRVVRHPTGPTATDGSS